MPINKIVNHPTMFIWALPTLKKKYRWCSCVFDFHCSDKKNSRNR